ncbi:serine/threonine-protein kinase TIO-like [Cucumis melo var. makuwa]|uniref:Serine/threonine-protein kinase TIO-like n=1 Tax=Cucumis melo var. makuwa TaxID=1194695 RepID=A0A5D3C184_CUCMM|nr:serine/threonine-protein kinase TIO-like [Cucumis melo var. makuwa]TYK05567.1 serine/threonine-protein kinase TIO-like [Cucumis melo var. makuwa]
MLHLHYAPYVSTFKKIEIGGNDNFSARFILRSSAIVATTSSPPPPLENNARRQFKWVVVSEASRSWSEVGYTHGAVCKSLSLEACRTMLDKEGEDLGRNRRGGDKPLQWDLNFGQAEFALNKMVNQSTGKCPFEIVYIDQVPHLTLDLVDLPFSIDLSAEAILMAN